MVLLISIILLLIICEDILGKVALCAIVDVGM